jgi:hypothetical protein
LSGLWWTRVAAWRSAAEVRGDGETAMGKDFGGAGGGGRQGDEEQVELPEQGDEQLVQEASPLRRRCGADVKRWESSFIVVESTLRVRRRRRRIGGDACDGVEDDVGGDTDVELLLRPAVDRST